MRRYSLTLRIDTELIDKTKLYFERQYRCSLTPGGWEVGMDRFASEKEKLWDLAFTVSIAGRHGVIIPMKLCDPEVNLLVYQDYKEEFHTEIVRLVPDYPRALFPRAFTGFLVGADSVGNTLHIPPKKIQAHRLQYAAKLPAEHYVAPTGYEVNNTALGPVHSFSVTGAHNRIGNVRDYFKCFDNNPGDDHLYEVMLCVSQPAPGSREPWEFSPKHSSDDDNPVFVGHVFLVMKEKTAFKTILRNVGFYPEGNVWPYDPADQGCLNNDSYTDYNIALNIKVNSHQFNKVLNYLSKGNDKGYQYNLNSNNCTNFALDALREAGIIIPRTGGKWHHGGGLNPGDLGEDLRTMKLSSNMKLITVYQAHGNQGNCY